MAKRPAVTGPESGQRQTTTPRRTRQIWPPPDDGGGEDEPVGVGCGAGGELVTGLVAGGG